MIFRRAVLVVATSLLLLLSGSRAQAQGARGAILSSEIRFDASAGYRLRTTRSGRRVEVALRGVDASLKPVSKRLVVHRGGPLVSALAARNGTLLVALAGERAGRPFVRFSLVASKKASGKPGVLGVVKRIDATALRVAGKGSPANVVACADPDGFTVLWQEQWIVGNNLNARPEARTYMARIAPDGSWLQKPKVVAVPWAFGAIVHNGAGYHLALFYDLGQASQTRLCFVTLSPQGQPQQHPWFATKPQLIDEVQLMAIKGGVVAYYRGGPKGGKLRSVRATATGQWGNVSKPSTDHGSIANHVDFALRRDNKRRVSFVLER